MSTLKVDTILKRSGTGTITLGQSGDTISIPSGATMDLSNATQTGVGGLNTPLFSIKCGTQSLANQTMTKIFSRWRILEYDLNFLSICHVSQVHIKRNCLGTVVSYL